MVGGWIQSASPAVAELMAASGFDFLAVDAEHSPVDTTDVQLLFQAIRAGNPDCAPLVRMPGTRYDATKRYMDLGAEGVIAPLVRSPDQAREVVAAVKFPPEGRRGVGFCRANGFGRHLDDHVASANDETFVCLQIEDADGVAAIDAILAVPSIDAVFVGPYDLSASLGHTGEFDHPDVRSAEQAVREACRRAGVAMGIHVIRPDIDELVRRHGEGYRCLAFSLDVTMIMDWCDRAVGEFRRRVPAGEAP